VRDAIAVARNLVEQPRDPAKNGPNDGGSPQRSGRARWSEILTRYELWDDLIAATTSGALDWSNVPFELEQKAYTLGQAYAARNELDKLAVQIETLRKLTSSGAKAALAELEGWQSLARGDVGPALDSFAKATTMRPEALARAHLKARNFGSAEVKIREAVARNPNQVAPLAAQVEILHACGKDKEAREAYRSLEPMARSADQDVPVFRRLAEIVKQWKADKSWVQQANLPAANPPQQTSRNVAQAQREKVADELLRTDLEIFKIQSEIAGSVKMPEDRERQIREEFVRDPEVIALGEEIATAAEQRDGNRRGDDAARRASDLRYKKLMARYEEQWELKRKEIGERIQIGTIESQSVQSIKELGLKLQALAVQREKQTKLLARLKADDKAGTDEINNHRIDLTTLGPLAWSPFPAETFSRTDTAGAQWSLADKKGKDVLILFFLGGKCAHCMQQLQLFGKELDALKKLNVETVAIGTDDLEASKSLKNNKDGIKFPMPILPDPKQEIFKLYQAYDDFEGQPLHGTILIDSQGNVRFQRVSADPFLDVDFIKAEAERVNRIVGKIAH
jgi:peroxiredoxin